MVLRSLLYALTISISTIFSSGCQIDELIFYEHEPSKTFYKQLDMDALELKPYITDGILFIASLVAINQRSEYIVWLGLYSSDKDKQAIINKAIIESDHWHLETSFDGQTTVLKEKFERANYYQNSVKLFQIKKDTFEQTYNDDAGIRLKIYFEINDQEFRKEYTLIRRVEKHVVYPT